MAPTTIAPPKDPKFPEAALAASKARCKAQGGTWDTARNICVLPERGSPGPGDAGGGPTEERLKAARQISPRVAQEAGKAGQEAFIEESGRQKALSDAEALGFEKEGVTPVQEPAPEAAQEIPEIEEAPGILSFSGLQNLIEGRPVAIGGKTFQTGLRGTEEEEAAGIRAEVKAGVLPIGLPTGAAGAIPTLLDKANKAGKVKEGVKQSLKSPGILKNLLETAKNHPIIAGVVGYKLSSLGGDVTSVAKDVALRDIKKLDTLLGKMGEEITAFDAMAKNGFYIGESGEVIEYSTKDALKDLDDAYEFLNEAERKLQEANIYQKFFLLTSGEDLNIQGEIDKLRTEIQEETGNIIATQLEQPETLTAANDFFRRLEAEGYDV